MNDIENNSVISLEQHIKNLNYRSKLIFIRYWLLFSIPLLLTIIVTLTTINQNYWFIKIYSLKSVFIIIVLAYAIIAYLFQPKIDELEICKDLDKKYSLNSRCISWYELKNNSEKKNIKEILNFQILQRINDFRIYSEIIPLSINKKELYLFCGSGILGILIYLSFINVTTNPVLINLKNILKDQEIPLEAKPVIEELLEDTYELSNNSEISLRINVAKDKIEFLKKQNKTQSLPDILPSPTPISSNERSVKEDSSNNDNSSSSNENNNNSTGDNSSSNKNNDANTLDSSKSKSDDGNKNDNSKVSDKIGTDSKDSDQNNSSANESTRLNNSKNSNKLEKLKQQLEKIKQSLQEKNSVKNEEDKGKTGNKSKNQNDIKSKKGQIKSKSDSSSKSKTKHENNKNDKFEQNQVLPKKAGVEKSISSTGDKKLSEKTQFMEQQISKELLINENKEESIKPILADDTITIEKLKTTKPQVAIDNNVKVLNSEIKEEQNQYTPLEYKDILE
jgi:hypothetical protein